MEESFKKFGDYLFELRMLKGVSLVELGRSIGISANRCSELERGVNKKVGDDIVRNLAIYYDVPEERLFTLLGRVPLAIKEQVSESPELARLLADIAANKDLSPEKRELMISKVRSYYESLVNDD